MSIIFDVTEYHVSVLSPANKFQDIENLFSWRAYWIARPCFWSGRETFNGWETERDRVACVHETLTPSCSQRKELLARMNSRVVCVPVISFRLFFNPNYKSCFTRLYVSPFWNECQYWLDLSKLGIVAVNPFNNLSQSP